ncbi:MAG: pyridoxal phosphate-dependent aminotransferase, partial [Elusimicrobia bacterium]|nr:pyridoxal phosphate-dependent aminotransferase [Elusimicrobiota bacterium]
CGAKHSLYNLFQTILDDGDEIIIPAPYWVSYPDIAYLAGAVPVIIQTSEHNGFKITPEDIKKAVTKKTKAIVINSPSNPTGSTYTKEELTAVVKQCLQSNIFIVADEIYEKLVFDNFDFCSVASTVPEAKDHAAIINGVSKAYSMTGWRVGYTAAPKEIVSAMTKIQSQSTSNPTSIAMKAAVQAISGKQTNVAAMRKEFQKRRDYIVERLNSVKGITCLKPTGAFYVFPNVSGLIGKTFEGEVISNDMKLVELLLEKALIAVVPGSAFGAEGFMRLSYAYSMENIKKGMDRLEVFVSKLT